MIPLLIVLSVTAATAGLGVCLVGFVCALPFSGKMRVTYWSLFAMTALFGLLAAILAALGVSA